MYCSISFSRAGRSPSSWYLRRSSLSSSRGTRRDLAFVRAHPARRRRALRPARRPSRSRARGAGRARSASRSSSPSASAANGPTVVAHASALDGHDDVTRRPRRSRQPSSASTAICRSSSCSYVSSSRAASPPTTRCATGWKSSCAGKTSVISSVTSLRPRPAAPRRAPARAVPPLPCRPARRGASRAST